MNEGVERGLRNRGDYLNLRRDILPQQQQDFPSWEDKKSVNKLAINVV